MARGKIKGKRVVSVCNLLKPFGLAKQHLHTYIHMYNICFEMYLRTYVLTYLFLRYYCEGLPHYYSYNVVRK